MALLSTAIVSWAGDVAAQLAGKRLGLGSTGSGTQTLAADLRGVHGVTATSASFVDVGGQARADQMLADGVDAAYFVGAVTSPLVQALFRERRLAVADLALAETYSRLRPHLSVVSLPPGVIDVALMIPATTGRTVAATSSLAVRKDLHPSVIF